VTLVEVKTFAVSRSIVAKTEESLRRAGREGYELFVLWSGVQKNGVFDVRTAHVPRQTSYQTRRGLSVRVDGEALHRLNVWLYEHEETLGAQVHAHPRRAYHSKTDDSFPIVTILGGLSLVVPNFCRADLLDASAAFRLTTTGWREDRQPVTQLVEVV
jgi:hypothetical protein